MHMAPPVAMATSTDGEVPAASSVPVPAWETTIRGKGKVRLRKAQQDGSLQAPLPRLTAVAYRDALHGELCEDPAPRHAESVGDGWVQYVTLDTPQNVYQALSLVWKQQPVLLRGSSLAAGLVGRWSFQHLAKAITGGPELVAFCSDAPYRFLEADLSKNAPASVYHVREPETRQLTMAFPEFVQCVAKWKAQSLFTRATVMRSQLGGVQAPAGRPAMEEQFLKSQLQRDVEGGIDWEWLMSFQRSQRFGPVARVDLEAGTANGLLPARYERGDALLVQVTGRRRVLLISPGHAFEGLYPYPLHHTYDRYSMVDLESPDLGLWPKFSGVRGVSCILQPGDALFVPQYWYTHVQLLEPENICLALHLQQGSRAPSPDSVLLRLSRVLEERIAAEEGVQDVRHWLQLIGHGEEHEWIDLGTVAGYRRAVFCQSVRDDVDSNVGPGSWAVSLPRICEGRLVPTPWLNKNFREPLYLLDKPVRLEDTRTEEERKYPELFRAKLEAEGWSIPKSASTVPIPGYNMPMGADYRTL